MCNVQFWLAPFIVQHESLEKRRNYFTGRPAVHHGFQRCWNVNGLGASTVVRVCRIAAEAAAKGRRLRVITTGAARMKPQFPLVIKPQPCFGMHAASDLCERTAEEYRVEASVRAISQARLPATVSMLSDGMGCSCSGHSLGGALATLAAYEIAKTCPEVDVACYTFGAPRTGNHAFAKYAACSVTV